MMRTRTIILPLFTALLLSACAEGEDETLSPGELELVDEALDADEELVAPELDLEEVREHLDAIANVDYDDPKAQEKLLRAGARLSEVTGADLSPMDAFSANSDPQAFGSVECDLAWLQASFAGSFAGIAETYARLNYLDVGGSSAINCYIDAIQTDAQADVAAVEAEFVGLTQANRLATLGELEAALDHSDDAVWTCGWAAWFGTQNAYNAYEWSDITNDALNTAYAAAQACDPLF